MKRIVFVIAIISFVIGLNAQNQTIDFNLDYSQSFVEYTGSATDNTSTSDSTWTFTVQKNTLKDLKPYIYLPLDSIGGTANAVTINIYSKVFTNEDYTLRESVTWANGADTTITIESDSAHHSRIWRTEITGQDNTFIFRPIRHDIHFKEQDFDE